MALWANESSALRWSPPATTATGSGEADTYIGIGWIGWTATGTWIQWLNSMPTGWAQSMDIRGWDYFDAPALLCVSSDPNNTHAAIHSDGYMADCMAALGSSASGLARAVPATGAAYSTLALTTAAPFSVRLSTAGQGEPFAPEAILVAYGSNLATGTLTASTVPLPTSLGGNSVTVTDSAGAARPASLFYVAPSQINFELPAGTAAGIASVSIQNQDGSTQYGTVVVGNVAPGLYMLDSSRLVAAWVLAVVSGAQQPLLPVYRISSGSVTPFPIDLGGANEGVYLEMFGTGFRNANNVTCTVGNFSVPVLYAGAAPGYAGGDQINVGPLPSALAGKGSVNIVLTADGKVANLVNITIH